ncbi:MAG: YegP family protein [Polyangiales bacterium]
MSRSSLLALVLFLAPVFPACAVDASQSDTEATTEADDAVTTSIGKFETFAGKDGKTYFHLLAGNGQKVLASEGYASLESAKNGVASVKANGTDATRYELRTATSGEWYFVLKAGNGAVIGVSETYVSQSNAERAIASVVKVVTNTVAVDAAAIGAKFQIFKGLDARYYFHMRAQNGEIVLQSESYTAKASATNGVDSVRENGANAARYEIRAALDGQYYFVLKAGNGQIIARGETYASRSNAEAGVKTCVELLTQR